MAEKKESGSCRIVLCCGDDSDVKGIKILKCDSEEAKKMLKEFKACCGPDDEGCCS